MRILYVVPRYWPSVGGAQLLTREFVHRVSEHHDVNVVSQFTADQHSFLESVTKIKPGQYKDGNIPVFTIGPTGIWRPTLQMLRHLYGPIKVFNPLFACALHHTMVAQLKEIADRFNPDILHAVHIGLVFSSEAAFRAAQILRLPFVWTPLPHIEGPGWKHKRFRRLYGTSTALIAMTHREQEWLVQQGAKESSVHVVPMGPIVHSCPDGALFRQTHNLGEAPVILFLGQKRPYKGYRELLDSAPLVWDRLPDVRFVFIGPNMEGSEAFFGQIKDRRVIELPAVDLFVKTSALSACDVFCMPSTQESLGGVYLEAWSFRKPVIAARIQITQEVIDDGTDGLLVEQRPETIAEAIINLLTNRTKREAMGNSGFEKVQSRYDWNRLTEKLIQIYSDLTILKSSDSPPPKGT